MRHLIVTATGWGADPDQDATYLNVTPSNNDGSTVYALHVTEVPVDGFWSISGYDADGRFRRNERGAYTINNLTAHRAADGSVTVQFGGCDDTLANCPPILPGWNYMVRLYPTNILFEAALSFLGVGVQPPTPSWGGMLSDAVATYQVDPTYMIVPGLALFITVLSFNLFGDGLRDALDPRAH